MSRKNAPASPNWWNCWRSFPNATAASLIPATSGNQLSMSNESGTETKQNKTNKITSETEREREGVERKREERDIGNQQTSSETQPAQ